MSLAANLSLDLQKDVGLLRPAQHPLQFQSKVVFCFYLVTVEVRWLLDGNRVGGPALAFTERALKWKKNSVCAVGVQVCESHLSVEENRSVTIFWVGSGAC